MFILCDALSSRFPVRYASQGFIDLYELGQADVSGRPCGDIVGGEAVKRDGVALAGLAERAGLSEAEATTGLDVLTHFVGDQCHSMLERPKSKLGFALLVNRRGSGALFTCELLMFMIRRPRCGWCCALGMQRDVTNEISPEHVLTAAVRGQYEQLVDKRRDALKARLVRLGAGTGSDKGLVEFMYKAVGDLVKAVGPSLRLPPTPLRAPAHQRPAGMSEAGERGPGSGTSAACRVSRRGGSGGAAAPYWSQMPGDTAYWGSDAASRPSQAALCYSAGHLQPSAAWVDASKACRPKPPVAPKAPAASLEPAHVGGRRMASIREEEEEEEVDAKWEEDCPSSIQCRAGQPMYVLLGRQQMSGKRHLSR